MPVTDLQHYLFLQCQDNKLYLSPAGKTNKLRRVLDAGTGTGIWAVEFGDQHPEASVSRTQPPRTECSSD